jgi:hypothetical protein
MPRTLRSSLNHWTRRVHRWATVATAVPLLVVVLSGILLQLKKDIAWVQPPTKEGAPGLTADRPGTASLETVLATARGVPEAGVRT